MSSERTANDTESPEQEPLSPNNEAYTMQTLLDGLLKNFELKAVGRDLMREALRDAISIVAFRAGVRFGQRKSTCLDNAYHDALHELYVALGGNPKNMC